MLVIPHAFHQLAFLFIVLASGVRLPLAIAVHTLLGNECRIRMEHRLGKDPVNGVIPRPAVVFLTAVNA